MRQVDEDEALDVNVNEPRAVRGVQRAGAPGAPAPRHYGIVA